MRVCKCTELRLWSGGYFLPLIGVATGLGRCLLGPDKDAVCGLLLGACVAAPNRRPDPPLEGRGGVLRGLYLYACYPPFKPANMGISQSCFAAPPMSFHSVTEPRGFLTGTLPLCVALIPCGASRQATQLLKCLCEGDSL